MIDKIDVNGDMRRRSIDWMKAGAGLMGTQAIKWNFTKFLVDREGQVVATLCPATKPERLLERTSNAALIASGARGG